MTKQTELNALRDEIIAADVCITNIVSCRPPNDPGRLSLSMKQQDLV